MATRRKSVKNEAAKPETEEATAELPGMEADKDRDAATQKSGEETVAPVDDVAEADVAEGAADVKASEEAPASEHEGEISPERGPRVHLPNLVCVRYTGDETWTLREAITMPYPEIERDDIVVTDRTTARWLTRKGMPFTIVDAEEALAVISEDAAEKV